MSVEGMDPCIARPSPTMILTMQDMKVHIFPFVEFQPSLLNQY